jgi:translation initiation factor 2 beta subunit (eIF-2beta)/eIF-5
LTKYLKKSLLLAGLYSSIKHVLKTMLESESTIQELFRREAALFVTCNVLQGPVHKRDVRLERYKEKGQLIK